MRPKKSTTTQFVMRNTKPTLIGSLSVTSTESTPAFRISSENPKDKPISTLKTGPAKQAVMAMLVNPFFAMVTFADKSLMEFPNANIVTPMMVLGIRKRTPRKDKSCMRHSAMESIHVAATMKPYILIGTENIKESDPSVAGAYLKNKIPTAIEQNDIISMYGTPPIQNKL